ncbi:ribonucleotide reductase of class III (anaerobic), activating protein [Proteus phage PM2]|uniref:Anaerobic ribonucleoside-triphosphate reductase-activating protein n=1 Tax=Proteus phage PM2 TaxID=2025809 RepID=A0A249XXW6_9CAUD|nr:anaerobic ribonucleotide reductase small subunit [Proteus phage PM2]ASZ76326.1 ribonucleotide reductase of class III (anaerobic), activating protein [Proteus phage PM2]
MNYASIIPCDSLNGIGFRTVLFVTGCSHKCEQCYNKSTWNPRNGQEFTESTLEYLITMVNKPYINGLTISGGDPLYRSNIKEVINICKRVKEETRKSIWIYTGYEFNDLPEGSLELLDYVDVIIDGKYDYTKPTDKPFRGSDNQKMYRKFNNEWSEYE